MTLEELRQAALAGEPGARDALARRLRTMISDRLSKRLPADVVDDLTQQALLKIFTKLEDFIPWHDDDAFERWVIVIYSRVAKAHAIAQYKTSVRNLHDPNAVERLTNAGAGPSTQLRNQDLLRAIARIVAGLATPFRVVFETIVREGRIKDAAAEHGIKARTAYRYREQARQLIIRGLATPTS